VKLAPLRVVPDAVIEVMLPSGVVMRVPGGAGVAAKLVAALASASASC